MILINTNTVERHRISACRVPHNAPRIVAFAKRMAS